MAETSHAIVEETVRLRQGQENLERRINSLQGRPASSAELTMMVDYQAVADPVFRDLGMIAAPGPLANESLDGYRRRLAAQLQNYARDSLKDVVLSRVPRDALAIFEKEIYADAATKAADRTWTNKPGTLREIKIPRADGRTAITEFAGDPLTCWGMFMRPVQYLRDIIHPNTGRSYVTGRPVR